MRTGAFPLERLSPPIVTFPRLSPRTAYTATSLLSITCSRSTRPEHVVAQTGKAKPWVQQRGSGSLALCHDLQCLTRNPVKQILKFVLRINLKLKFKFKMDC